MIFNISKLNYFDSNFILFYKPLTLNEVITLLPKFSVSMIIVTL